MNISCDDKLTSAISVRKEYRNKIKNKFRVYSLSSIVLFSVISFFLMTIKDTLFGHFLVAGMMIVLCLMLIFEMVSEFIIKWYSRKMREAEKRFVLENPELAETIRQAEEEKNG